MADQASLSNKEIFKIRDKIVAKGAIACFQALMEVSGADEAVKAVKPYSVHSGMAMACNCRKRLGFSGSGFEEAALPLYWVGFGLSNRNASIEIFEKGAVVTINECPFKGGPPEMCVAISHHMGDGICENFNPRMEYIFTHHVNDNDPFCRYIVRQKGGSKDPEAIGRFIRRLPDIEMPDEEAIFLKSNAMGVTWSIITEAFLDLHGHDRMLELVRGKVEEVGRSVGNWLVDEGGFLKSNVAEVVRAVEYIYESIGQRTQTIKGSEHEVTGVVFECPFKDSPNEVCEQMEIIVNAVCKSIDPTAEFYYLKDTEPGKKKCSWVIRAGHRNEDKNVAETQKPSTGDPLKALTLKYAVGEITKDEYNRMVRILESINHDGGN